MIFHVVEFTSNLSKEKTVIPDTWMSINNNTCAMPPLASGEQLEEATKNPLEPEDGWAMYSIKSLRTFESYDEAKDYLQKSKEGLSEDEPRRKRKKPSYLSNYTSMDSDEEQNTSKSAKIVATRIKREDDDELEMEELSDIEWIPSSEQNQGDGTSNKESSSGSSSGSSRMNESNMWGVITDLLTTVKNIETKVDSMLNVFQDTQIVMPEEDEEKNEDMTFISSLPVGMDGFSELNEKIGKYASFREKLRKTLSYARGKDVKALACNILRKLITDDVGEKFSLTGKTSKISSQEKQPFEKTEAYKLILEVCSGLFKNEREMTVREAISEWLMQAKYRKIRRKERAMAESLANTVVRNSCKE